MVEVIFDHVTKIFGEGKDRVVAVDDVSFTVKDRELVVLLGPSGSGKSTLLRLVAGLEIPTKGDIIIGDKVVTELPPRERDVAMVFQSYALYPFMSAFDNIAFPLKLRKMPKDEIKRKVEQVAEILNIKHLLHRMPAQLSGGEMQRVALARCIVRNPQVFLFDEPLSNLDAKLRVTTRGFLKRLQKDLGITSIYVTHDQEEAMSIADRIVVLDKGKVQQIGTPEEVYNNPQNIFVAGFLGSPPMNLVEGRLIIKGEKKFFEGTSIKFEIPPDILDGKNLEGVEKITLGARPESVKVVTKPGATAFKGRLYVTESVGSTRYAMIETADTMIRAVIEAGFNPRIGDEVYFTIDMTQIYLFNSDSGARI
ncbi:MAG: ABC transporter ATP-binding protein [Candidatus Bathyarchaeia archaeon]